MTYTNEEYAEIAMKANKEGKVLKKVKGKLKLIEDKPIALTDKQIVSQNQVMKNSLINDDNERMEVLQNIIDLDMQESNQEKQQKQWRKYRILLTFLLTFYFIIEE